MKQFSVTTGGILFVFIFACMDTSAQTFTQKILNGGYNNSVTSLLDDVDGDGDLDIIISQSNPGNSLTPYSLIYLENDSLRQFRPQPLYSLSLYPVLYDKGDMDNDGDTDYLYGSGNKLTWLRRQSGMSFVKQIVDSGKVYTKVSIADFNLDGNLDVVALSSYSSFYPGEFNVYLSSGATFIKQGVRSVEAEFHAQASAAGDLDQDGDADLILSDLFRPARIYWNDGTGYFQSSASQDLPPMHGSGEIYKQVVIEDVNNDSISDIVTFSGISPGGCFILDGANSFTPILLNGDIIGGNIQVADFDGNGYPDILLGDPWRDMLLIHYQDSNFIFRLDTIDTDLEFQQSIQLSVGDLDEDGDMDLFCPAVRNGDEDLIWYENINGQLIWHGLIHESLKIRGVKWGDIDNDGDLDAIATLPDIELLQRENEVHLYENLDGENFRCWRLADHIEGPWDVELADVDQDGDLDAFVTAKWGDEVYWLENTGMPYDWGKHLIENNAGEVTGCVAGDIDGDGDVDLAVCIPGRQALYWYENDSAGSFTQQVIDTHMDLLNDVEIDDFDNNGTMDLAVVSSDTNHTVLVYFNNGTQQFSKNILYQGETGFDIEVGDWDGQNGADIFVSFYGESETSPLNSEAVGLFRNNGTGNFLHQSLISSRKKGAAIRVADVDLDGDQDLVYSIDAPDQPLIRAALNRNGAIVKQVILSRPEQQGAFVPSIDVGDVNGDGLPDLLYANSTENNLYMTLIKSALNTSLEVEPLPVSKVHIYPNPTSDQFIIEVLDSSTRIEAIEIVTILGNRVFQQPFIESRKQTIDLSGWDTGVYIVLLKTSEGTYSQKLVKTE